MEITLSLCLPRDARSIPVARRIAGNSLASVGFLAADIADVTLAITEACTNVLRHTRDGEQYEVRVLLQDETLRMEIIDAGQGFAGDGHGRVDAETGAETGRGIQLMRAIVDDLRFTYEPGRGSVVSMIKQLRYESDGVAH